jgi:hypothetical protein
VPHFSRVLCARSGEFSIRSTRRIHLSPSAEFLTAGLRDAFPHGGAKTSILFKQAQGGILHQPLGIRTGMAGDLG